jgi:hypothetical protein
MGSKAEPLLQRLLTSGHLRRGDSIEYRPERGAAVTGVVTVEHAPVVTLERAGAAPGTGARTVAAFCGVSAPASREARDRLGRRVLVNGVPIADLAARGTLEGCSGFIA